MKLHRLLIAGLVLATLVGCGNRSIGNKIDDQFLEPEVRANILKAHADLGSDSSRVVVTSYNGVILIAGQTPREDLKQRATQAASAVQGVKRVHNEMQIMLPNSALARSNDAILTTKIKTQMMADTTVPASRIKVVTENGIVYLLGLITRQEAVRATNLVQNVNGVQKIIKLFQYTD